MREEQTFRSGIRFPIERGTRERNSIPNRKRDKSRLNDERVYLLEILSLLLIFGSGIPLSIGNGIWERNCLEVEA